MSPLLVSLWKISNRALILFITFFLWLWTKQNLVLVTALNNFLDNWMNGWMRIGSVRNAMCPHWMAWLCKCEISGLVVHPYCPLLCVSLHWNSYHQAFFVFYALDEDKIQIDVACFWNFASKVGWHNGITGNWSLLKRLFWTFILMAAIIIPRVAWSFSSSSMDEERIYFNYLLRCHIRLVL